ncbi:hypothetical protein [Agaribacterium haliotis]|uniref:hypothetical protein n=1 Tax=Agaribacterium haliotis TaxID=2013869 RepID=UPI0011787DF3|nr:hypothetical protein [Agaribacterium haliotis]
MKKPLAINTCLKTLAVFISVAALAACSKSDDSEPTVVEQELLVSETPVEVVVDERPEAESARDDMPYVSATYDSIVTATVKAVDYDTRVVTLLGEDGGELSIVVSDDARNLSEVVVGDVVTAEYVTTVSFELVEADEVELGQVDAAAMVRAEEGQKPGVAMVEESAEAFEVSAINLENNTFKLTDVDGVEQEYSAANPENLKKAKVGDRLIVSVSEAVAIDVTENPAVEVMEAAE